MMMSYLFALQEYVCIMCDFLALAFMKSTFHVVGKIWESKVLNTLKLKQYSQLLINNAIHFAHLILNVSLQKKSNILIYFR